MGKKAYVIDVSKLDSLSRITVDDILEPDVLVFYGNFIGLLTKTHKGKKGYIANLENTESCHADSLLSALVSRLVNIDKKTLFFGAQEVLTYWRSLFVEIFGIVPENLTPIENAKERKDVKVWWVNGYKDNIRLAVKTDDNINIKEIVADNIRFMYPAVRPKSLKHADFQTFYDNEAKSITKFVKYAWGKNVKINKIIGNPPYNVGSQIIRAMIEHCMDDDTDASIIGPLSMYKSNGLYKHVEDFGLEDPEMFKDATITNNLCICTLRKPVVNKFKTYEELSMESYGPKFKAFYEVNKPNGTLYDAGQPWANNKKIFDWNDTWVYLCRAAAHGVHSEDATDRRWNLSESRVEIDDIQKPGKDGNGRYSLRVIKFVNGDTRKSCRNLSTWFYAYGKEGLADKLLHSLKKNSGSIEPAIPQIDWEAISDTQLWKEGKYDEAVLDVMGLKWNDDKSGVVKK